MLLSSWCVQTEYASEYATEYGRNNICAIVKPYGF